MFRTATSSDRAGIARLLLRTSVGGTMIAHGLKHGRSVDGTAGWFGSIGFRQPRLQAQLSSVVEIGSGTALVLGAATPLSASAVVGTMGVAVATVHRPNGFFITDEGWEYTGLIAVVCVAVSALGSGPVSLDRLFGLHNVGTPAGRAAFTAGLGLAGAAGQLALFWRGPSRS